MKPIRRSAYRLLLLAFPPRFRRSFGAQLMSDWDAQRLESRYGGRAGTALYWIDIARDALGSAARQRVRQAADARRTRRRLAEIRRLAAVQKRSHMDILLQDIAYSLRTFQRRPGFAALALLSLAIGIGANSSIFGLVDGLLLRPFAYPDADRLVGIGVTFPKLSSEETFIEALSVPEYLDLRSSRTLRHVTAFDLGNRNLSGGDVPERVFTALLIDDPFPVFGVRPALGRGLTNEELSPGGPAAAVISHRIWQSRFGGDSHVIGRTIRVNGQPATLVGVMPPELLLLGADLWIPWGGDPHQMPRQVRQFTILARLAPGASLDEANAELATIAGRTDAEHRGRHREYEGWRLAAAPWAAALTRDARPAGFMLLVAVGFVLLIACANLTSLMLARATGRHRELAVRFALGAARGRVVRQMLTESMLLALGGCLLGIGLAHVIIRAAVGSLPAMLSSMGFAASVNQRVLFWSLGLALVSGLIVGFAPAVQASRTDPHALLRDARASAAPGARRLRHAFVLLEIALSVVLLAGAGLLLRSYAQITRIDPGFDTGKILTMRITLPREKYEGPAISAFFNNVIDRVAAVPGVRATSAASQFPPFGTFDTQFSLEGAEPGGATLPKANITIVSRSHFETLGLPILAGRAFGPDDRPAAPRVAVVNRAFASRFLKEGKPIGPRVRIGEPGPSAPTAEIVGVVSDARNRGLMSPTEPEIFILMEQQALWNQLFLLVRADLPYETLLPAVRREIAAVDPEQPIYAIQTLDEAMGTELFQQRLSAILLAVFAGVALVLAGIGIYGVMSYAVVARTQEIGVRMAIGAARRDVMRLVMGQVMRLSLVGLALGLAAAAAIAPLLRRLLFGVEPHDPVTLATVTATLCAVAALAGWLPARRASRVDPLQALRMD